MPHREDIRRELERDRVRGRGRERARRSGLPRGIEAGRDPVGTAFIVVLIVLVLASVLLGDRLGQAARGMPIGSLQTAAKIAVAAPEWLNKVLRIDKLADGIRAVVMGPFEEVADPVPTEPGTPPPSTEPTGSLEPTDVVEVPLPDPDDEPGSGEVPAVPGAADYRAMTPSAATPVSVIIHGDSMTEAFGKYLRADLVATGQVNATHDFQFSSGLARPDFYDWPKHLREVMAEQDPDIVVMMFGANDGQNVKPAGTLFNFGTPEWRAWYEGRVAEAMDIVAQQGRRVYWVSLPNARDAGYASRMKVLNDVFAAEAAKRPTITYVDSWALFAGPDGSYQAYQPDSQGTVRLMRQDDGIHLSIFGAHKLSDHLEELIARDVGVVF